MRTVVGEVDDILTPEEVEQRREEIEKRRQWKKEQAQRRLFLVIGVVALGLVLMGVSAYISYQSGMGGDSGGSGQAQAGSNRTHVLVMGVDEPVAASRSRTDTMLVVSVDSSSGEVGVLSIPRDTRVWIPGRNRWDRANTAYAYGGASLAMETVSHFLQTPISHYVVTDFSGFEGIIDTLGGVEIDVQQRMFYVDRAQDLVIDIEPGQQVLDGEKALQYVRFRDRLGDVSLVDPQNNQYDGRVERQRKFVMAMLEQVLRPSTIPRLPSLIRQVWTMVDTNLSLDRILSLAWGATKYSEDKTFTALVPGEAAIKGGASYWVPDLDRMQQVVATVLHGKPVGLAVEVLNGNGRAGEAGRARDILSNEGIEVINLANADSFDYPETIVRVYQQEHKAEAEAIADLLDGRVELEENNGGRADATVVLGQNFSN